MAMESRTSSCDWEALRGRIKELVPFELGPVIEILAAEFPDLRTNEALRLDCIYAEFCFREECGQEPSPEAVVASFPESAEQLRKLFEIHAALARPSLLGAGNDAEVASGDVGRSVFSTNLTVGASQATVPVAAETSPTASLQYWIGGYRILNKIASGGMGVVYKAHHPQLDRVAAIKLIKSGGLDDGDPARRFELEARAAAKLDHPGIVPVYEIGKHEGRLFLVMAYVEGESLSQRVLKSPLEPLVAARILQQVAEAIQYAHRQGIVHRDLKPQNILLTIDGQPRITDFGLAKQQGTDSSLTGTGDVLGTPSYMPPEQASGKCHQIGPLSDVYALGATLYAVLTGRPPFQAASTFDTLIQVLNDEPIALRVLNPSIHVDLETICLKALQKDPARRYASAQAFADDLLRFQNGEAILARPVGRAERTWRWCRKNPVVAGMSTAAALLLLTVTVISTFAYFRERRFAAEKEILARQESQLREQAEETAAENKRLAAAANVEREKAVQLAADKSRIADEKTEFSDFLVTLFRTSDPLDSGGKGLRQDREQELTASAILERALKRLSEEKHAGVSQSIRVTLLNTLGDVQRSRGELETAEKLLTEAQSLGNETLRADDPTRAETLMNLSKLRHDQGAYEDAVSLVRQSFQLRKRQSELTPIEIAEFEFHLAKSFMKMKRSRDAVLLLKNVVNARSQEGVCESSELEAAKITLMQALLIDWQFDEALKLNLDQETKSEIGLIQVRYELTDQLRRQKKYPEALHILNEVIALAQSRLGPDHPLLFAMQLDLADILRESGDYGQGLVSFREAVKLAEKRVSEHPTLVHPALTWAELLFRQGVFDEAERLARQSAIITERPIEGRRINLCRSEKLIAAIRSAQGNEHEAETWLRKSLNDAERTWTDAPASAQEYDSAVAEYCRFLCDQGRFAEAEALFETRRFAGLMTLPEWEGVAWARRDHLLLWNSEWQLSALILREQGQIDEAQRIAASALSIIRSHEKAHYLEGEPLAFRYRAKALEDFGDHVLAEQFYRQAVESARSYFPARHPEIAFNLDHWARSLMNTGKFQEAELALREAIDIELRAYGHPMLSVFICRTHLAEALAMNGNPEAALQTAADALAGRQIVLGAGHPWLIDAEADYARLCQLIGHLDEAETHFRTALELATQIYSPAHPVRWKIVPALADILIAAGKPAEARELLAALLAESAPVLPENSPRLADLRERIGKFERISLSHLP